MIWLTLLLGCDTSSYEDLSVHGVELLMVQATPPTVAPSERLNLKAWVADAQGIGAEVLLWPCTPVDPVTLVPVSGLEGGPRICLEGLGLDRQGMALAQWTQQGTAHEGVFMADTFPPALAFLLAGGDTPIDVLWFALACAPGECEVIDRVRANPAPGSPSYERAVQWLAAPELWMGDTDPDRVSLAVKVVTVSADEGDRQVNPILVGPTRTLYDQAWLAELRWSLFDPREGQVEVPLGSLQVEVAASAGAVVSVSQPEGEVVVLWRGGVNPQGRPGRLFVSVSDGQGGTTADLVDLPEWSSAP